MIFIASGDGDGLSYGGKPDLLENFDCTLGWGVLEDSEGYLFLDNVDCHFDSWLRKLLKKSIFDLGSAVGAADAWDLNGVDLGIFACLVLGHNKVDFKYEFQYQLNFINISALIISGQPYPNRYHSFPALFILCSIRVWKRSYWRLRSASTQSLIFFSDFWDWVTMEVI